MRLAFHNSTAEDMEAEAAAEAAPAAPESQTGEVRLPGFGAPIDTYKGRGFLNALSSNKFESHGVFLRERRMLEFMNQITDKPEWEKKVFDETIVAKWKKEADVSPEELEGDVYLSEAMFDHCIKELRYKASISTANGFVNVLDAELNIVKSDTAVSQELKERLRECVKPLEDVPDVNKDWHPGSDEQVLDLLHPSLFPVVYGVTRALRRGKVPLEGCQNYIGKGAVTDTFPPRKEHRPIGQPEEWGSFQWLPSDVEFTETGVKIASYINNLHPDFHGDLYKVLESFVNAALPLWDQSLLATRQDHRRIQVNFSNKDDYYTEEEYPDKDRPEDVPEDEWDEEEYMWTDEYDTWWRDNRILRQPEPNEKPERYIKRMEEREVTELRRDFPNGLQIIFKLANIHLTPEEPSYEGGSWHVEGALNEHICATALYYYDEENITESHLAFRSGVDIDHNMMIPAQGESDSLEEWLGTEMDAAAVLPLGQIHTREGRMLVFPNALQHQVQPFGLHDLERPGHRKILAMFLVDPHSRVLSTGNVPPQQRSWWAPEVRKISPLADLPQEVFDMIISYVDFPMGWEQALSIREELMDERRVMVEEHDGRLNENTFSFCEH